MALPYEVRARLVELDQARRQRAEIDRKIGHLRRWLSAASVVFGRDFLADTERRRQKTEGC